MMRYILADYRLAEMSTFHWLVLIFSLFLCVCSCLMVIKRLSASQHTSVINVRLINVITVNVIAFISVILLTLPIESQHKALGFDVLITSNIQLGADLNSDPTLIKQLKESKSIWILESAYQQFPPKELSILFDRYKHKVKRFMSLEHLNAHLQSSKERVNTLKIYGNGFSSEQWPYLKSFAIEYYPSDKIAGFIDLHWPKEVSLGETFVISGAVQGATKAHSKQSNVTYEVSLMAYGHEIEKTRIQAGEIFTLKNHVKIPGKFVYQLIFKTLIDDTPQVNLTSISNLSENIAFTVVNEKPLNVLIKQSAPSFETRQLTRWLAKYSAQVTVFTEISKEKWQKKSLNLYPQTKDKLPKQVSGNIADESFQLTEALLADIDFAVFDIRTLRTMQRDEVLHLYNAIEQGLGVYIFADNSLLMTPLNTATPIDQTINRLLSDVSDEKSSAVSIFWPTQDQSNEILTQHPIGVSLKAERGEALVYDHNRNPLVSAVQVQLGMFALSTIDATYQWHLQNHEHFYRQYWQYIIKKLARNQQGTRWLPASSLQISTVNEVKNVCLLTQASKISGKDFILSRYPQTDNKWCGRYTALVPGWQPITAINNFENTSIVQYRYFYPKQSFLAWRQARLQNDSLRYSQFINHNLIDATIKAPFDPIDKSIFWLIFVLSSTILWLERKFFMN